jgi:flagellar biosynthesis protein FlhA
MKIRYAIKSVPSDDPKALEDLLNEMAQSGWDLYTMQEIENEDGFVFNCIFTSEYKTEKKEDDIINIKSFRSQMEKILYSEQSPYQSCKEIQEKIKQQRKKIQEIKTELEKETEVPVSKNRQKLNDQMSENLKKLEDLRQNLVKAISPSALYSKIKQDKLTICLGEDLLDIVNPDLGAELVSETVKSREKLVNNLGYVFPKIVFEDDYDLDPFEFSIKIRGLEVLKSIAFVNSKAYFEDELNIGKKKKNITYDEITGKNIVWIEKEKTKDYWQQGISAAEYISRMLEYVVIKHIDELFDYNDVNKYIELVTDENAFLCENIIPDFLSVSDLKYVLINLIKEDVSIKDIVYIFEKLNDYAEDSVKEDLIDKIRLALSSHISKKLSNEDNIITAFDLSEKTYKKIFADFDEETNILKVEDEVAQKVKNKILKVAKKHEISMDEIVLCVPQEDRRMLFLVLSHLIPKIKIISRTEISSDYTIEILDEI